MLRATQAHRSTCTHAHTEEENDCWQAALPPRGQLTSWLFFVFSASFYIITHIITQSHVGSLCQPVEGAKAFPISTTGSPHSVTFTLQHSTPPPGQTAFPEEHGRVLETKIETVEKYVYRTFYNPPFWFHCLVLRSSRNSLRSVYFLYLSEIDIILNNVRWGAELLSGSSLMIPMPTVEYRSLHASIYTYIYLSYT